MQADEAIDGNIEDDDGVKVENEMDYGSRRDRREASEERLGPSRTLPHHYRHHNTKSTSSSSGRSSRSAESFAIRRAQSGLPVVVLLSSESYSVNVAPLFDGSLLASYGQAIVVTINYRIGILGESTIKKISPFSP